MRWFLRTVIFCLTIIMAFATHKGADAEMSPYYLPESIGPWSRPESPRVIDSTNIFKYMNGAGELYLGFRFDHLEVFDYTSENQDNILVELYFMKTSDDAFGLLSLDWGGEPVNLNHSSKNKTAHSVAPSNRALYGGGLLRIWSDNLYARVMAFRETPLSKQTVLALGKAITANRKSSPEPELLKIFPLKIGSAWKLRRDRLSFFRSYLALNSIYYLSHENILDLDLTAEAVTAPYERISSSSDQTRSQFLLVKYENHEHARKALDHFHNAYLPEHKKEFTADSANKDPSLFKIEDGWVGYELINNYVVVVFDCPDQKSAITIIRKIESNLLKKGGYHER